MISQYKIVFYHPEGDGDVFHCNNFTKSTEGLEFTDLITNKRIWINGTYKILEWDDEISISQ